jgi:hypothetical protein
MDDAQRARAELIGGPSDPSAEDGPPPEGHPVLGTALACLVLLLVAAGSSAAAPSEQSGAYLAGRVFAQVAICWGVAWWLTIRRTSRAWQAGSFAIVTAVAILTSLYTLGGSRLAAEEDRKAAVGMMNQAMHTGHAPAAGAGSGPISRMASTILAALQQDSDEFDREAEAAGVAKLLTMEGMSRTNSVLAHCDGVAAMAAKAMAIPDRMPAHIAAAHPIGAAAVADGKLPAGQLDEFEAGLRSGAPKWKQVWSLSARLVDDAAGLCRTLAHSAWTLKGRSFLFTAPTDAAAFDQWTLRARADSAELQRVQAQRRRTAEQDLARVAG